MAKKRRIEFLLSIVLLAAGTSLLVYAGAVWFRPAALPEPSGRLPSAGLEASDLPPALLPAPSSSVATPFLQAGGANELKNVPLLPESPLAPQEETADLKEHPAASHHGPYSTPQRILIPALDIDAPVVAAGLETHSDGTRDYTQWAVPNAYAAGWHEDSAALGQVGNMVLNGHNNVYGAIFAGLAQLPVGEQIIVQSDSGAVVYRVVHHELLQERGLSLRERLVNARWIGPTGDQRLTLVTCWPNTTNSHRLIVVAEPSTETVSGAAGAALNRSLVGQIAQMKE